MVEPAEPATPAPISFDPSQAFDGIDGKWSTFTIRVGTPEQSFRVLPSGATGETIIPVPEGCTASDAPDCAALRGAYPFKGYASHGFSINDSTTWKDLGLYDVDLRKELNYSANGLYGLDNVGLMIQNSGGPTLFNQVVAGIASKDFYLGIFGLSPKATNFSGFEYPQKSFMTTLKEEKKIPSISYGYTAGAYYKSPKVLGSLTIGGYDASRFSPNNNSFPFDIDDERPLSLNVQRISVLNSLQGAVSLLDNETYVQIDFTVPYLWLPQDTCDRFASAFGLIYDNTTGIYITNSTMHSELLKRNPSITIGLGATPNPEERVNIVLPYNAFSLQATQSIHSNATINFPIRRGANESQYTLGRVFVQEAYLIVDYERGNFSVAQALFPATNEKKQIIRIDTPELLQTNDTISSSHTHPSKITPAVVAGISVGMMFLIILCVMIGVVLHRRRKRILQLFGRQKEYLEPPGIHENTAEALGQERFEMPEPLKWEIDGCLIAELSCDQLDAARTRRELPA